MEEKDNELNYFIEPGGMFTCWEPYRVATVLGSSVAICLTDTVKGISGMNNFAFPQKRGNEELTKFGDYSIPKLIEMMIEYGAEKDNMEAHIIGGAFSQEHNSIKIGKKNTAIAKKILKKHGIRIINEDTGGVFGRKVLFNTETGEIIVLKSKNIREKDWYGDKSIDNR